MRIYKYPLTPFEIKPIALSPDSEPLSVVNQNDGIVLYVRESNLFAPGARYFALFPTGDYTFTTFEPANGKRGFIGTVQLGALVFHCFEVYP